MKLNVINNNHGTESKAWYSLKPLQQYHDAQGIDTMWGMGSRNFTAIMNSKRTGKPYILSDMPYWDRWNPLKQAVNPSGEYRWRVSYCNIHCNQIHDVPHDRIKQIDIKEWRTQGEYVLVAPSSPTLHSFIGQQNWIDETVAFLKTQTDMPIKIRHKPRKGGKSGPAYALVPLADDLAGADCVVTSCSMVAVDAVIEGIPVYSHELSATNLVSNRLESFGNHLRPDNREQWLASLSYHQFTGDEFANGMFASVFKELYQI